VWRRGEKEKHTLASPRQASRSVARQWAWVHDVCVDSLLKFGTKPRKSTCICDRESMSLKSSSSAILHRERANKVFGKRSSRLLARFFKFFITAHLLLHRTCAEGRRLQCKFRQADHRHQGTASHVWFLLSNHVLPIGYIDLRRHDFAR
jgi:hypothetical protein